MKLSIPKETETPELAELDGPDAELDGHADTSTDEEFVGVEESDMKEDLQPSCTPKQTISVFAAEQSYLISVADVRHVESEIDRLESELSEARQRHAELTADRDGLAERLCRVLEQSLKDNLEETDCEVRIRGMEAAAEHGGTTPARADSPLSETPTGDYSGLSAPISELWADKPIERFGAKKREALLSCCPTIGDFEALREQAGRAFKQLHEMLPDGIGGGVADELEERQLTWLAKHAGGGESAESESPVVVVNESVETEENEPNESDETETENPYQFG